MPSPKGNGVYEAGIIKRQRATKEEMGERAEFLIDYAQQQGPVTVRQLYYQAVVRGITGIGKIENGYTKVQRQVLNLRRTGLLPYQNIADSTRWMRKPQTWNSVRDALRETAAAYRKALWRDQRVNLELWLEKNALAGVVYPVTAEYDVPLMPTAGYTSETFAFEAVETAPRDKPYVVWAMYDFDRSGQDAATSLKEKVERFAADRDIEVWFQCLAIEAEDIDLTSYDPDQQRGNVYLQGVGWRRLPTREHKRKSVADQNWPHPFAIELDAIEPDDLRAVVRWAIEEYLPQDQLRVLQVAEESERELIADFVASLGAAP